MSEKTIRMEICAAEALVNCLSKQPGIGDNASLMRVATTFLLAICGAVAGVGPTEAGLEQLAVDAICCVLLMCPTSVRDRVISRAAEYAGARGRP